MCVYKSLPLKISARCSLWPRSDILSIPAQVFLRCMPKLKIVQLLQRRLETLKRHRTSQDRFTLQINSAASTISDVILINQYQHNSCSECSYRLHRPYRQIWTILHNLTKWTDQDGHFISQNNLLILRIIWIWVLKVKNPIHLCS